MKIISLEVNKVSILLHNTIFMLRYIYILFNQIKNKTKMINILSCWTRNTERLLSKVLWSRQWSVTTLRYSHFTAGEVYSSRAPIHTLGFPECSCCLEYNIYSRLCRDYGLMINGWRTVISFLILSYSILFVQFSFYYLF